MTAPDPLRVVGGSPLGHTWDYFNDRAQALATQLVSGNVSHHEAMLAILDLILEIRTETQAETLERIERALSGTATPPLQGNN